MKTKFIIVTGGVISGLGKGIITSSIGSILKRQGFNVSPIKIDPYINIDAGTMRPTEHGEVWVTDDGGETDMDLGNYERFMDINVSKENSITTGQVYLTTIQRERNLEFKGSNVEVIPHIPEEVIRRIKKVENKEKPDFIIVEIGGTVGDYQSVLFLEAAKQLNIRGEQVVFVHVVYLPIPNNLGEMKTKPAQHSIRELNYVGIQPDFIIARANQPIDDIRRDKLSMFCNVKKENIISSPNLKNVYAVPCHFEEQGLAKNLLKLFNLKFKIVKKSKEWKKYIQNIEKINKKVNIAIIGKYFNIGDFALEDSYASVIEAIRHASWHNHLNPDITWIDSKDFETNPEKVKNLKNFDAVIVPGGFGSKGIEGKIKAIKFVRENNIPFLGLCYGMQLAVIEYARNVCNIKNATSHEINPKSKNKVVHLIHEQKEKLKNKDYGGTMRLGSYPALLKKDSLLFKLYKKSKINERHRHRYEINPKFIPLLEEKGILFSGRSPNNLLMEFMELKNHKFFIGTQAHPEFKSKPLKPSPVFDGLIKATQRKIY